MNALQFALYKFAASLMEPEERVLMRELAARADRGDKAARKDFMDLAEKAVSEAHAKRRADCQKDFVK
jgi:hypothetical protein